MFLSSFQAGDKNMTIIHKTQAFSIKCVTIKNSARERERVTVAEAVLRKYEWSR